MSRRALGFMEKLVRSATRVDTLATHMTKFKKKKKANMVGVHPFTNKHTLSPCMLLLRSVKFAGIKALDRGAE